MSFGKYTLFSAYASTANGNMSPIAFAILFGGETTDNWIRFWDYAKMNHPSINRRTITIITDQNPGCISAIAKAVPEAFHFHCSWHRRQNIIKKCGGNANLPGSALWMFNHLSNCRTNASIVHQSETLLDTMHPTDRHYLTKIANEVQYPAARCSMGEDIYMYGRSASSGNESMNRANMSVRRAAAVDALNACIQMLRLEAKRYEAFKKEAWNTTTPLTPFGMKLMEQAYKDVHVNEFTCDITIMDDHYHATVSRLANNSHEYNVRVPKASIAGSRFGSCTCGVPKRDGVPCVHMIVLAKGGHIDDVGFTRLSVMPSWLSTSIWRSQFPEDSRCRGDVSIQSVKNKHQADDQIRYAPDWSAPKKAGRPKKDAKRKPGVMDEVARKRKKTLWCEICHKFNHNTRDCFKNPSNLPTIEYSLLPEVTENLNLMGDVDDDGGMKIGAV